MKQIPLKTGGFTIVDDQDYDRFGHLVWAVTNGYVQRKNRDKGKGTTSRLHRIILGLTNPDVCVDHINHDPLDNRRCNLRVVTQTQNKQNRRKTTRITDSQFKGVVKDKQNNKWRAQMKFNDGRRIHLGLHLDERDAARVYDKAARLLYGRFAHLNFGEPADVEPVAFNGSARQLRQLLGLPADQRGKRRSSPVLLPAILGSDDSRAA